MLRTRVVTALALLLVVVPALIYLPPRGWAVFVLLFVAAAGWEWGRLARLPGMGPLLLAGLIAGSAILVLLAAPPPAVMLSMLVLASLAWLLLVPFWLARRDAVPSGWPLALLGWLMLLACWYAVWRVRESGAAYLFLLMGVVWVADIAAYFAGRAFGRHKLAPNISPGKTWEGVVGAILAVQCLAALCVAGAAWLPNYFGELLRAGGWPGVILAGLLLTGVSVIGDLFESLLKRRAEVKDSSNLLPGHGGVLDRIDALLPTLPVALTVSALIAQRSWPWS